MKKQLPPKKINAVIVRLCISMFSNQRQDQAITDDVKMRKALGRGAGKWVKYKLPAESLKAISEYATMIRQFHYNHTSPWEEGTRLLSQKARITYDLRMAEFKKVYMGLVDEFGKQYPDWIKRAKEMHAGTFDQKDYPEWPDFRASFDIGREYFPVPQPDHFSSEMKTLYGAGLEAVTEKKLGEAISDTWDKLIKPVKAMAEKLGSPDAIFRDTLVSNVKEMAELIPMLNMTGDKKLKEAAEFIQTTLATLDVAVLRENKVERKNVAEKAAQILTRFGGIGKRKLAT
jgi:hypothetical protein